MNPFISYLLLGLSLAAPIGPINAAQLDRGIKNGFLHAWMLGIGAMLADAVYMLLVYFGTIHFLNTPFLQTFLWLFGCFVLLYTGIEGIAQAGRIESETRGASSSSGIHRSFFTGFFLSLSNPLTILFWLGIYGSVLAETAANYGTRELILYSAAILSGIILWDAGMAFAASGARRWLTSGVLKCISIVSGISLIGFGMYFGYEACRVLFG